MNPILPISCLVYEVGILPVEIEEQLLKKQAAELEFYTLQLKRNLVPTFKEIIGIVIFSYSISYSFAVLQNLTLFIWVHNMDKIFSNHARHYLVASFPLAFQNIENFHNVNFETLFPFSKPEEITATIIKYFQKQNPDISSSLLVQCLHSFIQIEKMHSLVPYIDCSIPSELLGTALPLSEMRNQLIELHNRNLAKYSVFYKIMNSLELIKISVP